MPSRLIAAMRCLPAIATALLLPTQGEGQDLSAPPLYGQTELRAGFLPDPHVVEVLVGGPDEVDVGNLDCVGFYNADAPDFDLYYEAGSGPLGIFVESAVDTTLIVNTPSGEWVCNDDAAFLDRNNPGIELSQPLSGLYNIWVGNYDEDGHGEEAVLAITEYAGDDWSGLSLAPDGGSNIESDLPSESIGRSARTSEASGDVLLRGQLDLGDATLDSGEYYDSFRYDATAGESLTVDLGSTDFDTYLIVNTPSGASMGNDDSSNGSDSQLQIQLEETGTYVIAVTSYAVGETGDYELRISTPAPGGETANNPARQLTAGEELAAALNPGEVQPPEDEIAHRYLVELEPGEFLRVDMQSDAFDTYLTLITPNGERYENDDHLGDTSHSRLETVADIGGRYEIVASSYGGRQTGSYRLSLSENDSGATTPSLSRGDGAQIFGLFTGIADYAGDGNDLPLTDQDARRARDALIEGAGMNPNNAITLLNSEATRANFRQALTRIGTNAGPEDTLVVFYSGHGNRVPRADGPNSQDPDGMDETIVLYDDELLDDELANMLNELTVGKILLVMDSCFSGGFSKDVIARPGRMGLFSSEEDVLSQVASKFQAGGYLSVFFEEALTGGYADQDDNGELTAIELSQYLHLRFRSDVKSFDAEDYVRASGPQASYQQLVVDRGGIGPYHVLFTRY